MSYFYNQIIEDIKYIQEEYSQNNPLLIKDEYAFNYWVLTKLFNVDIEIADDFITEYNDKGIDCYVFFEDSKELYIIQNKYYSENTKINRNYIQEDFLSRPLNYLANGNYKRSEALQNIFNKIKDDPDFRIYLYMYVSNDLKDNTIIDMFDKYQCHLPQIQCYVSAKIFYLTDIVNLYFEERKANERRFICDFYTVNKGTVLNIDKQNYNLPNLIQAKYILTPVSLIYKILKKSKDEGYSLFAENIREYLGNKGVNANIAKTLESETDRANFFYYNNGITVICDDVKEVSSNELAYNKSYRATNPQIVNGCQTVNTIYEVLKKLPNESEINDKYKSTFVMVKLLMLNARNEEDTKLYENIVKYNNSQNKIDEKLFAANTELFNNLKRELKLRGFLLAVKQSDAYTFKMNEKINDLRPRFTRYGQLFNINFDKIEDIIIPLETLLQVILAFEHGGYQAYTKKSKVLKIDSPTNQSVIDFVKNGLYTIDNILHIYLLYLKAEREKKQSEDKRTPIPFYMIGFLGGRFINKSYKIIRDAFDYMFSDSTKLDAIYLYYKKITIQYKLMYNQQRAMDYNIMIKSAIDNEILAQSINLALYMVDSPKDRATINEFLEILKK